MHILVVGLNYRTAPVEIREKFTFPDEVLPKALQELKNTRSILECVIVSTCNRTEIYTVVDRLIVCGHYIREFMENWFGVSRQEFASDLYIYEDQRALEHLFRVASGLDSMIIGETQILGQIRSAFLLAQQQKTTGTLFNMLFKQAVTLAKRAHSETSIGESAVSVSYAAVELGKQIFGSFKHKNVMIIGAGKMSELTVKHLHAHGADKVIVANRTIPKARELADRFNGISCSLDQVESMLSLYEVDVVISSTGSNECVLTRKQVEAVMKKRKARPLFMIDIAVPRDLDPEINQLPNVFLYDIDDLQGIVESNLEQRQKEALKVEDMIRAEVETFRLWFKMLGVSPVIRALQEKASQIHEETMNSLLNKLPELDERERTVIRKLSKSMVNQMLHDPIMKIKEMAVERHGNEAVQSFAKIFALEEMLADRALPNHALAAKEPAESGKGAAADSLKLRGVLAHS